MPNPQQHIAGELSLRTKLLPGEISEWNKQSDANQYGMGIHQSQVRAVTRLFDGMLVKQNSLRDALAPATAAAMAQEEFTGKRQQLEQSLTGTHSIMATFRYIFSQRDETQPYKRILDAADLVAAYSYLPCMKIANRWREEPDEHYREPPLIYLNAKLSPAAITRRHFFGLIGLELQGEEELQLPISVISISFHDTAAFWTLSSIYHEVGHVLDQDLGLRAELGPILTAKLAASQNKNLWAKTWLGEMIADVFGVLLGGAGFAYALMNMLFKTRAEVVEANEGVHPNSYLRMLLVCAMLRRTGVDQLKAVAEAIAADWMLLYGEPPQWKAFVDECATVAEVLLTEPLATLGKKNGPREKCLLDFARHTAEFKNAPDLLDDYQRAQALAKFLLTGEETNDFTIAMEQPESLIRLVPAAAQLAMLKLNPTRQDEFDLLHKTALDFLLGIEHEQFLADPESPEHDAFIDRLIDGLDFSSLKIENT
jgi:hypothetical protein